MNESLVPCRPVSWNRSSSASAFQMQRDLVQPITLMVAISLALALLLALVAIAQAPGLIGRGGF